jgi:hypothetical protein
MKQVTSMAARMEPKQRTGFMNSLRLVWNDGEIDAESRAN